MESKLSEYVARSQRSNLGVGIDPRHGRVLCVWDAKTGEVTRTRDWSRLARMGVRTWHGFVPVGNGCHGKVTTEIATSGVCGIIKGGEVRAELHGEEVILEEVMRAELNGLNGGCDGYPAGSEYLACGLEGAEVDGLNGERGDWR